IIAGFLKNIGVKDEILAETELIEHVISSDTVEKIDRLNEFFSTNEEIVEKFKKFKKNSNEI
ncbi:MAG: iron dependent repressor, metal binding and dimerization domain protein, partial [Clostridium butyricum]